MSVVLGATVAGGTLWFALVKDGELIDSDPHRYDLAGGLTHAEALLAGQEDLAAVLTRLDVDLVALAEGETNAGLTYPAARDRFTPELVLEFAAAKAEVELVRVTRGRIRSKHEFPKKGSISSHAGSVIDKPLSPHWNKRDVAALAALASG